MATRLETIFFDVGNTLLFPDRDCILHPLIALGHQPDLAQWQSIEREIKRQFDDALQQGSPGDASFWQMFYDRLLLEFELRDPQVREALVKATHQSANWRVIRPSTRTLLQQLGQRYRLAVISNADGRIEDTLRHAGIADCFATIIDSGLVGYEKPHPAIFKAALDAMQAQPAESLYVGDVYSVDYIGATRAGMQAILFDVAGAYRNSQVSRVESLEELSARLQSL